jgi:hypothetical protein
MLSRKRFNDETILIKFVSFDKLKFWKDVWIVFDDKSWPSYNEHKTQRIQDNMNKRCWYIYLPELPINKIEISNRLTLFFILILIWLIYQKKSTYKRNLYVEFTKKDFLVKIFFREIFLLLDKRMCVIQNTYGCSSFYQFITNDRVNIFYYCVDLWLRKSSERFFGILFHLINLFTWWCFIISWWNPCLNPHLINYRQLS